MFEPNKLIISVTLHNIFFFLANIHCKTEGELQSPIHYAAKYNAVGSLKVLLQFKARMNDRDYKRRTPLFIAAEMCMYNVKQLGFCYLYFIYFLHFMNPSICY